MSDALATGSVVPWPVSVLPDLASLKAAQWEWDIIFCAAELPEGGGLDALEWLRREGREVPFVLVGDPGGARAAAEAIRAGCVDFITTSEHDLQALPLVVEKCTAHHQVRRETARIHGELQQSVEDLHERNGQLETLIRQLETMARTDELTGLTNRRWLNLMLEGSWAEAVRHGSPLAFIMIDLDGFKFVNDRHGHQRGDEILRQVGRMLDANCRDVDVSARYGGDEFCVLLPQTSALEAAAVADRLRGAFSNLTASRPETETSVGMSIGVAHIDISRPVNAAQLVAHADEALYAAKEAGRNSLAMREQSAPRVMAVGRSTGWPHRRLRPQANQPSGSAPYRRSRPA